MEKHIEYLTAASKRLDPLIAAFVAFYDAPIIQTIYSHSAYDDTKIDGTQKKGFIVDVNDGMEMDLLRDRVSHVVEMILKSIKKDLFECKGCNGYLLNWANITIAPPDDPGVLCRAKVSIRGCPAIVPDGFDFARANMELKQPLQNHPDIRRYDPNATIPYGGDLLCHPAFVKPATPE